MKILRFGEGNNRIVKAPILAYITPLALVLYTLTPLGRRAERHKGCFPKHGAVFMSESDLEFHRKTAMKCFNEAWDYLDKK